MRTVQNYLQRFVYMCIILVGACRGSVVEIVFIVPDNYTGPLLLVLVPNSGPVHETKDGRNVYRFSDTGILCVQSFDTFKPRFRLHMQYEDGTLIPQADGTDFSDIRALSLGQKWSVTTSTGIDGRQETYQTQSYCSL